MINVVLGMLAIAVGALFCFRGYLTMRIVIPIWGAFAGFVFGAGLVSGFTGDGLLATLTGWLAGVAVALVFGWLAYAYFEVALFLAMGAIGFVTGASIMVAFDVTWTWVIVLAGLAAGIGLALLAIAVDLPMIVLTVLTASGGATVMVAGLMLLLGSMDSESLTTAEAIQSIDDSVGWWLLYAVLLAVGVVVQLRTLADIEQSVRAQWAADGGRQFRAPPT